MLYDVSMTTEFSLIDPLGRIRIENNSEKKNTYRRAVARGKVFMKSETAAMIASGAITKGDVLAVARVAGIQAAKQTSNALPLSRPLLVSSVYVNYSFDEEYIEVETQVETTGQTGVEMEALHSCMVTALTIYDMCKSSDRTMSIGEIALWEKSGGASGTWRREEFN